MILEHLNWLAIAVSAIVYFMIGGMWFSPIGFSKAWVAGHGIVMGTDEESKARMKKEMPRLFMVTFVLGFIATIALACFIGITGIHNAMTGAKLGLAAAVFPFTTIAMTHMYTRKSFTLTLIDAGYHIVSFVIVAVILSVWH